MEALVWRVGKPNNRLKRQLLDSGGFLDGDGRRMIDCLFKYIPIIHLLITNLLADNPLFGPGVESHYPGLMSW